MILRNVFQDFFERSVSGSEKGDFAVFTSSIEDINETRIILDQLVKIFMVRGICEEFVDCIVDVLEMGIATMRAMRPVRPVWTFWMAGELSSGSREFPSRSREFSGW